jgi:diacylglycerol kinase family enzyme
VLSFETPSLIVETESEETLVSLDGEPIKMQNPLRFTIEPKAIPVLRLVLAA